MDFNDLDKEMSKRTLKQYCSSWNELRYDEMHSKPYFIGKRNKSSSTEIICPVNCSKLLSYSDLKSCIVDSNSSSINFAIFNADSSVLMYKAQIGLKPPVILDQETTSTTNDPELNADPSSAPKKRKTDDYHIKMHSSFHTEANSSTDCLHTDSQSALDGELSGGDSDNSEETGSRFKGKKLGI